jgi:hypothetical protein
MADKPTLRAVSGGAGSKTPPDATDFESLWLDAGLGDGITDTHFHTVPTGKPRDFFRVHPDIAYRRRTELYVHRPENAIDEQHFIVGPAMVGRIPEARLVTLATCIYRDGAPRIWPVKLPKDGEKDNEAWMSARAACKAGLTRWVKLVWQRRAYITREAMPAYAPDPDWSKLPPFNDLVKLAFGEHGIINDTSHPVYRELFGMPAQAGDTDGDDL